MACWRRHFRLKEPFVPHISILNNSPRLPKAFVASVLSQHWQNEGHQVCVSATPDPMADCVVLHLDQTVVRPEQVPALPRSTPLINGRVLDISKRGLSTLMLSPNSDWDGPVILKTNLNHFGKPERRNRKDPWHQKWRSRLAEISWRIARELPAGAYPILAHPRRVPGWVWDSPELIVEKFMPERDGDFYCLRGWMFLGSQGYGWKLYATDPLVKTGTMVKHDYLDDVPDNLVAFRSARGFDFGKFDYVVHDGQAILLDANKTPTFTGKPDSPRIIQLATGIRDFL